MRALYALPFLALIAALLAVHSFVAAATAAALSLQLAAYAIPWRPPRHGSTGRTFWVETSAYALPGFALLAIAVALGYAWATTTGSPLWWVAAVAVGLGLMYLARVPFRSIFRNDVAHLLGPDVPSHCRARATALVLGPFREEAVYRGGALVPSPTPFFAVLSLIAFVVSHRLVRGTPLRPHPRALATEVAGGAAFTFLVLGSGSIYPAVAAHVLANAYRAVVELQRSRLLAYELS